MNDLLEPLRLNPGEHLVRVLQQRDWPIITRVISFIFFVQHAYVTLIEGRREPAALDGFPDERAQLRCKVLWIVLIDSVRYPIWACGFTQRQSLEDSLYFRVRDLSLQRLTRRAQDGPRAHPAHG